MDGLDAGDLQGKSFACLPGCGFCCTFPPEASRREVALLRARLAPRPLPLTVGDGRTYLALQNKCGACTLLERRECQAYDLRPAHCRYFPFHLHFAEHPEAYVNYTCRGVVRAPASLDAPFASAVLAQAAPADVEAHARAARDAYAAFKRHATRAGAWGDVDAELARALAAGPRVFSGAWLREAVARAAEDAAPDDLVEDALAPFAAADVTKRPFYLAPDLRWLTFLREGEKLHVLEMDERGALRVERTLATPVGWGDPPAPVADGLFAYLQELARRRIFAGGVYAIVDDAGYETTVAEAAWWRVAEVVADLAVRARVLAALGVAPEAVADETARFYDSAFLDAPTIGGFL